MLNARHAVTAGLYVVPAVAGAIALWIFAGAFAGAVGAVSATLLIIAASLTHHRLIRQQERLPLGTALPEPLTFRQEVLRDVRSLSAFILFPPPPPIRTRQQRASTALGELTEDVRSMQEMVTHIAEELKAEAWLPGKTSQASQLTTAGEPKPLHLTAQIDDVEAVAARTPEPSPLVDPLLAGDPFVVAVKSAIIAERMELFMQPIVSLPSRRTRFFACGVRLLDEKGGVITAQQFEEVVVRESLSSAVDTYLLARVVPMVRHCVKKNLNHLFFCAISSDSLADPEFVSDILRVHANDPRIASRMVFELPVSHFRHLRKVQLAAMQKLVIAGFRFAADRMQTLKIDYETLSERYVRFLKIPAPLLLVDKQQSAPDTDLSVLRHTLDRIAIDLIVERVSDEATLREMLDFGIDYGQGTLLGAPKAGNRETMAEVEAAAREEENLPLVDEPALIAEGDEAPIISLNPARDGDERTQQRPGQRNAIPPELRQAAIRNARRAVAKAEREAKNQQRQKRA